MAKRPKKPNKTNSNTINSILPNNKPQPKSRQQIYSENYQKNKEKKKEQQKINYAKKKAQEELTTKQIQSKYYQAKHIEVLMPFSEYKELNKETKKLWLNFNWTLQNINQGITGIVDIMKLEQVTNNLIRDFWETAKSEEKQKNKSWNSLDYDEQQRLIRYWGYERTRIKNNFLTTAEQLEKQSQTYLKEIESAKFHEERGKVNCPCYRCVESKKIQGEIKAQILKDEPKEKTIMIEGECSNCYEYKKVSSESGLCKKCVKE